MKAKRIETPKDQFKPFGIEIYFENELEAKTMYHLFNRVDVADALDCDAIRAAIDSTHDSDFQNRLWGGIKDVLTLE